MLFPNKKSIHIFNADFEQIESNLIFGDKEKAVKFELNPEKRTLKKNASCRRIKATGGVLSMSKRKDMKQYKETILRMVSEGGTRKSTAAELELEPG